MVTSFQKPKDLKYTDMAIYIDQHMADLVPSGAHPDVELKVYEYIYLICYALAFKAGYFGKNFTMYDDFALYMAANVFSILIKRQKDAAEGKEFHGKAIKPVKSVLNYIKTTLYPFKVDYQQEYYREVVSPATTDNVAGYKEYVVNHVQEQYAGELEESYADAVAELPAIMESVLKHTQFSRPSLLKEQLCMSVYLTLIDQITLPQYVKNKISKKKNPSQHWDLSVRFMRAHEELARPVRLWHLDPSYANYVSLLAAGVKKELSKRAQYYIHGSELSPELVDKVLDTAYATYDQTNTEE